MSHYCAECHVYWWPYQTAGGCCPQCGGGTKRSLDPADEESVQLHRRTIAAARSRDLHDAFEAYYADREARRDAA